MPELTFLSAASMAEQIQQKKLSPVDLIEAHLTRIQELNPKLNAFVQIDVEGARRQALLAEEAMRDGRELGVLHGVPLSIKSSIEVAGLRWEAGTKLRAGIRGVRDAPLVARLRQAGAIILGVTNAPELLMAWETDNLLYGRTNNPWDLTRTPGGSSGGDHSVFAEAEAPYKPLDFEPLGGRPPRRSVVCRTNHRALPHSEHTIIELRLAYASSSKPRRANTQTVR